MKLFKFLRILASNAPFLASIVIATVWITPKERHVALGLLTLIVALLFSYWEHRLSHKWDIPVFRLHKILHHGNDPQNGIPEEQRPFLSMVQVECYIWEFIINLVGTGVILIVIPGAHLILEWRVLFMFGLYYTMTHMHLYHLIPALENYHAIHHRDGSCNWGPGIMDHVFGTYKKGEGDDEYENTWPMIPVVVLAALLTRFVASS